MKKLVLLPIVLAITLTGCASTNYELYAQTQQAVALSKSKADIARYQALADIAKSGDSTAKVAAVISINQTESTGKDVQVAAPPSAGDTALKWASVIFPSLTQIYGINRNTEVAIINSGNALEGKKVDNDMIVDLVKGRKEPIVGTETDVLLYPN